MTGVSLHPEPAENIVATAKFNSDAELGQYVTMKVIADNAEIVVFLSVAQLTSVVASLQNDLAIVLQEKDKVTK